MVCLIVHKQESSVLHTSALHIMELQRCLQWHIGALLLGAYKLAAILMQSSDKELCLVVACYGETRQSLPHVRLKPAAIGTLQVGCLRSKRIIVERCGDIGIVDVVVVEINALANIASDDLRFVMLYPMPTASSLLRKAEVKMPLLLVVSLQSTITT